jgi:ribonucleoside-diphosphate reductase alpha chain
MTTDIFRIATDRQFDPNTETLVDDVKIIDRLPPGITSCVLGAISWDKLSDNMSDNFIKMKRWCDLEIRSLNQIIDIQEYNIPSTEIATKSARYLGVGINGYATFAARLGLSYNHKELWQITHDLAEMQMFCLLSASNNLAKEVGECKWFYKTKYSQGILPIDHYRKSVDDVVPNNLNMDWEGLRESILMNGLRNSAFSAVMPVQSSSVISNSTNGIELPRAPLQIIKSKNRLIRQIVKDFKKLEDNYEYCWEKSTNTGYINICAVIQKFFDQSISANLYYDPKWFSDQTIPMGTMIGDVLYAYKMGLKTLYYANSNDGRDDYE